jgi:hypothetical protein
MLNDIQITSDYMSRWVVLQRRVGAVTNQRVLKVLFYVNILQCFFVVENFTAHESLRKMISHGPKFREPQHINWKHNFKIIMDAVEDYARRWIKREVDQDPELEFLSEVEYFTANAVSVAIGDNGNRLIF